MDVFPQPISNRRVRFALVGCGRIAKNHFDADRVMSLPMSADISDEDQRRVVEALTQALR